MENKEKPTKAIKAIHSLIIETRIMVGNKVNHEQVFDFLDELEYLAALLLESKDSSEKFNSYLKEMCESFNLNHIYREYVKI